MRATCRIFPASPAFGDRLVLNPARIDAMAGGLEEVAALPDPLARTLARMDAARTAWSSAASPQPIGVIGMIYESRPNVGADAAAIAIKSGNAILLRGGSESFHSGQAINAAITAGLARAPACRKIACRSPPAPIAVLSPPCWPAAGLIDLIIPRGGKSLVARVQREARVPVLAHAEGINHTYIHAAADFAMARQVLANAKMRRTGVCGATETC